MCKYIAQTIYFPSILSLLFVLSHAKPKETNKKTVSTVRQWMNNLSGRDFIIQVPDKNFDKNCALFIFIHK